MRKPEPQPGKLTPQPGQTMPDLNKPGEKHDTPMGRIDRSGNMQDESSQQHDLPPEVDHETATNRSVTDKPLPGGGG